MGGRGVVRIRIRGIKGFSGFQQRAHLPLEIPSPLRSSAPLRLRVKNPIASLRHCAIALKTLCVPLRLRASAFPILLTPARLSESGFAGMTGRESANHRAAAVRGSRRYTPADFSAVNSRARLGCRSSCSAFSACASCWRRRQPRRGAMAYPRSACWRICRAGWGARFGARRPNRGRGSRWVRTCRLRSACRLGLTLDAPRHVA